MISLAGRYSVTVVLCQWAWCHLLGDSQSLLSCFNGPMVSLAGDNLLSCFMQWAYGVTLWEIFSGGKAPYPGIHPINIARQLDTGYRMEKPLNTACSDDM